MSLKFNDKGELSKTIGLTYEKFIREFGTNPHRVQLITNILPFFHAFHRAGCKTAYIGGSFASQHPKPEDIDVCFDITDISKSTLENELPEFFEKGQREKIRKESKCHLLVFQKAVPQALEFLSEDRDGNPRGVVILNLSEIILHDQK